MADLFKKKISFERYIRSCIAGRCRLELRAAAAARPLLTQSRGRPSFVFELLRECPNLKRFHRLYYHETRTKCQRLE